MNRINSWSLYFSENSSRCGHIHVVQCLVLFFVTCNYCRMPRPLLVTPSRNIMELRTWRPTCRHYSAARLVMPGTDATRRQFKVADSDLRTLVNAISLESYRGLREFTKSIVGETLAYWAIDLRQVDYPLGKAQMVAFWIPSTPFFSGDEHLQHRKKIPTSDCCGRCGCAV